MNLKEIKLRVESGNYSAESYSVNMGSEWVKQEGLEHRLGEASAHTVVTFSCRNGRECIVELSKEICYDADDYTVLQEGQVFISCDGFDYDEAGGEADLYQFMKGNFSLISTDECMEDMRNKRGRSMSQVRMMRYLKR